MSQKRALITGIAGQDGSYLAELLVNKGYEVHGIVRRTTLESANRLANLAETYSKVQLHSASLENHVSLYKVINFVRPDECYHLAASSFVNYDFELESSIISNNFNSTHFLLASIREVVPDCRFYFAGSSEMFGDAEVMPQNECSRFSPRSIYGISKLAGYYAVKNYRDRYKLFACTGISYNHESERRGMEYVSRKVSMGVARIHLGISDKIVLGNIDVMRDWGYAPDYVQAMWRMLQTPVPKDYVLSTGVARPLQELLAVAFDEVGLDYRDHVETDSKYFRPTERVLLIGDSASIHADLGWSPVKNFAEMIRDMVRSDIRLLKPNNI